MKYLLLLSLLTGCAGPPYQGPFNQDPKPKYTAYRWEVRP